MNIQTNKVANMVREQCFKSLHVLALRPSQHFYPHKTYIAFHVKT